MTAVSIHVIPAQEASKELAGDLIIVRMAEDLRRYRILTPIHATGKLPLSISRSYAHRR